MLCFVFKKYVILPLLGVGHNPCCAGKKCYISLKRLFIVG